MTDAAPTGPQFQGTPPSATCARCEKALDEHDRVEAGDRLFCRSCYETLKFQLQQGIAQISQDVNYSRAVVGAVLGGVLGVLLWWGFTVATKIGFGLIAVAIGFLVGHGAVRFTGGKRSTGLQVLAVVVATLCFLVAVYLVNMTFINEALAERGQSWRVRFPPADVLTFYRVLSVNFGIMKLVFLAIVIWQAWTIPRAPKLPLPA